MQIDLLKERNRAWSRCAAEVGDAAGALYFMASWRACCCLTGFWSEMEEKSKGACTRSTTREKEESQGSTARGDAAHLQKELQQVQQQQQQQQVQQQQQAEQLGSTQRQRKQRPLPTASGCGRPLFCAP